MTLTVISVRSRAKVRAIAILVTNFTPRLSRAIAGAEAWPVSYSYNAT